MGEQKIVSKLPRRPIFFIKRATWSRRPQRIHWQQCWRIKQKIISKCKCTEANATNSPKNRSYTNTWRPVWTIHLLEQENPATWQSKITALLPRQGLGQGIEFPFHCLALSLLLYFNISVICSSHQPQSQWTPSFFSPCILISFSEGRNTEPK